jgi:hypothetical protein
VTGRDPLQRFARLIQRQDGVDLRAQLAGVYQITQRIEPLRGDVRGERPAGDAALKVPRSARQHYEDRPATVADRSDSMLRGVAACRVEQQIDAARNGGADPLDPVRSVVVEDLGGTEAAHVLVVVRAGHAQSPGAHGGRDLHGGAAHAARGGREENGLSGLQPTAVNQSLVCGRAADHQPCRLGKARPARHGGQLVRRGERQLGEPATRREQARVDPVARMDPHPGADRLDHAGDLLTGDEGDGNPRKSAADEADVPGSQWLARPTVVGPVPIG